MQTYRPYICPFERLLPHIPEGARVLDVGCGGGLFLGLAAELGLLESATGFDTNPVAIQAADLIQVQAPMTFIHIAAGADWPKGVFNLVTMIDVMHHIPRAERAGVFSRIGDRLEPGGLFVYKDINPKYRVRAAANRLHDLVLTQEWVEYLSAARARELAALANLEEVFFETVNRLWYSHDIHIFRRLS